MLIRLISHASVVVEAGGSIVWSDPWLSGTAFNDSWRLWPEAAWDPRLLERITHVWISHEHPDHFHMPTLRALPDEFKKRVTVLFQRNNSRKMFDAFARLGFDRFLELPHRKTIPIDGGSQIYCYQEGQMNSCLAIRHEGRAVLNVNDAEIRTEDCRLIRRDIGATAVVLNQFSLAGYDGLADREGRLPRQARAILQNLSHNHRDLGAEVTIPFASFIYFSTPDNRYMNTHGNSAADVAHFLAQRGQRTVVLAPGDVYDTADRGYDSAPALVRLERSQKALADAPFTPAPKVGLEEIREAFSKLAEHLHSRYPAMALAVLGPVRIRVPDLATTVEVSIPRSSFRTVEDADPDLEILSQPLHFAFRFPFGVQTLGVSARYTLFKNLHNWRLHRILFAMNNAEVYLRPRYLFSADNLRHLAGRMTGGTGQILRRWRSMFRAAP